MPLATASRYTPAVLKGTMLPALSDMAATDASTVGMF